MLYRTIRDSELSVDRLVDTNHVLLTESEVRLFQKTPWTWFMATDNGFKKNNNFYWDAGYSAFVAIADIDNILKTALKKKPLQNISHADADLDKKVIELNRLSRFLDLPSIKTDSSNIPQTAYACKIRGLDIAQICHTELFLESQILNANTSTKNKIKFAELINQTSKFSPLLAYVKGNYVNYIESEKSKEAPAEAYVQMIIKNLDEHKYYNILKINAKIDNIAIRPTFIPHKYKDAYSFFDLDLNRKSRFIHGNEEVYVRQNAGKILRVIGNTQLEKLRSFTVSDSRIESLRKDDKSHKKIYLAIRQAYLFHWQMCVNGFENLLDEPNHRYKNYHRNLPLRDVKKLLAEASIEVSQMTQRLDKYLK